jgi:type I restriction enzyme, R subunit
MTSSNFGFLEKEFPILFNITSSAEFNLQTDPVTALFKLRQFGEKLTVYIFDTHSLDTPAEDTFHNRIRALEDEGILQFNVASLLNNIKHRGNIAVHQSKGSVEDAKTILFSAFKLGKWF